MVKIKNISDAELLAELLKRINDKNIKLKFTYFYDSGEIRTGLESERHEFNLGLRQFWDVKASYRYRKNYETYCLPLVEQKQEKQSRINYEREMKEFKKILSKIN